jgi:hypothetical protein
MNCRLQKSGEHGAIEACASRRAALSLAPRRDPPSDVVSLLQRGAGDSTCAAVLPVASTSARCFAREPQTLVSLDCVLWPRHPFIRQLVPPLARGRRGARCRLLLPGRR